MIHAARKHARLAPSSAHRWLHCPGSVALCAPLQEAPSVFAAEGTAAHELAEKCLAGGVEAAKFKGDSIGGFKVDAEMVDAVQLYLDVAREVADASDEFETEQRMDMTELVPGVFGTADASAYRERREILIGTWSPSRVTVIDLKYGKGVAVEVEENEQELTYAMGVANRYHNRGVDEVELIVVQPRAPHRDGPVRRWLTDVVGLYEHVLRLQAGARAVDAEDAPLVPGAWCVKTFCKGVGAGCPAIEKRVREIIMASPELKPLTDWRSEATDIAMVKGWATRREEFAHNEAMQGRMPPGAKLVAKRSTRQWDDEDATVAALKVAGVDEDDIYESSLRSPAQVEKALPKKLRSIIASLATAKSSGTVLAPLDDPRATADPGDPQGFEAVEIAER